MRARWKHTTSPHFPAYLSFLCSTVKADESLGVGLTFIVNQVLLRFLSPQILGVATQLELFSISTLYFARESIRVAITRQNGETGPIVSSNHTVNGKVSEDSKASSEKGSGVQSQPGADSAQELKENPMPGSTSSRRIQEVVNISWVAINLGVVLTLLFEWLYVRKANAAVLATPHTITSLHINGLAVIIELLNEPCFAISQQKMMYGTRASAEMQATFSRCLITCATAILGSRYGIEVGVLPFAFGQLTYAVVLNLSYLFRVVPICREGVLTLLLAPVKETGEFIPKSLLTLASTFYAQSLFKQLLTSGDQYLIATLTTLASQGAYALASNYGSLLARVLFQPLEESSRALFARLISPRDDLSNGSVANARSKLEKKATDETKQATTYLTRLLHVYLILGIFAFSLGPPLSQPALAIAAGKRWSQTEAPLVLASYCYYIPLLALNGVLEAFVAAVATPAQLRTQSLWMVAFSLLFACSGFLVLSLWDMGARGLVLANAVTMVGRIAWSFNFVQTEIEARSGRFEMQDLIPNIGSFAVGAGARVRKDCSSLRFWNLEYPLADFDVSIGDAGTRGPQRRRFNEFGRRRRNRRCQRPGDVSTITNHCYE